MDKNKNMEWLKRTACTIASQLPDERRDALTVLNYAREIILNLGKNWEAPSAIPGIAEPLRLVSSSRKAADPRNPG
jgi:hypothetical protein